MFLSHIHCGKEGMHNHPSLPQLSFAAAHADCPCKSTSSPKFISTLLISWCISMSGNTGQRLTHPAPKSLYCPQQGRETGNRGMLSSAQQHPEPGRPRGATRGKSGCDRAGISSFQARL